MGVSVLTYGVTSCSLPISQLTGEFRLVDMPLPFSALNFHFFFLNTT